MKQTKLIFLAILFATVMILNLLESPVEKAEKSPPDQIDSVQSQLLSGFVENNFKLPNVGYFHASVHRFYDQPYNQSENGLWFVNGQWANAPGPTEVPASRPLPEELTKIEAVFEKEDGLWSLKLARCEAMRREGEEMLAKSFLGCYSDRRSGRLSAEGVAMRNGGLILIGNSRPLRIVTHPDRYEPNSLFCYSANPNITSRTFSDAIVRDLRLSDLLHIPTAPPPTFFSAGIVQDVTSPHHVKIKPSSPAFFTKKITLPTPPTYRDPSHDPSPSEIENSLMMYWLLYGNRDYYSPRPDILQNMYSIPLRSAVPGEKGVKTWRLPW